MVIEGRKLMILLVASFMTATSISGIAVAAQNVSSQNMTGSTGNTSSQNMTE
jgi:hypothetical protein